MAKTEYLKAAQLRELTAEELGHKLDQLVEEYFQLRIKASTGQLEQPIRLRLLRRAIARARTVRRERERVAGRA